MLPVISLMLVFVTIALCAVHIVFIAKDRPGAVFSVAMVVILSALAGMNMHIYLEGVA